MRRLPATSELVSGPPTEVLDDVDVAWERARELFEAGLELHFELDGGVRAEMRLDGGSVVERLSALQALAIACGEPELGRRRDPRFASALAA